jgi:hypothetical protein
VFGFQPKPLWRPAVYRLVTPTKEGRDLLESSRHEAGAPDRQAFHNGIQRPRELKHDAQVYRAYATICGCLYNRARLYHVRHHALYHAIGEPHSRYRRPIPAAGISDRLMPLDGMLTRGNEIPTCPQPQSSPAPRT